mgnify:CR=1 FL=1
MIYLLEDDESIRELVIYTLKSQGYEAKGFERPSLFWKELEKRAAVSAAFGCDAAGRGWNYHSEEITCTAGYAETSRYHADSQRQRV